MSLLTSVQQGGLIIISDTADTISYFPSNSLLTKLTTVFMLQTSVQYYCTQRQLKTQQALLEHDQTTLH